MAVCVQQHRQNNGFRILLLAAMLATANSGTAATYAVTNTNDSGSGSLRQAMLNANANAGADTITFNIPGSGPHYIRPTSTLPGLTGPTTIDGYSQPGSGVSNAAVGSNADLRIVIEGHLAGTGSGITLLVGASSSVIRGLVINQFDGSQIHALGGGCEIVGNYIGTDVTGMLSYPSAAGTRVGISVTASTCRVGGTTRASRNVVSGNSADGIYVAGSNNVVAGNIVGTNRTITAALGNRCGITVGHNSPGLAYSPDNVIGGANTGAATAMNYISGNTSCGIRVQRAERLKIEGNAIGLAALALGTIPNGGPGIDFANGRYVTVGNLADTSAGQFIIGNNGPGIRLGNGTEFPDYVYIGVTSIEDNVGLAIDLHDANGSGVTANDPMDPDGGPNGLQNFPVLTATETVGSTFRIIGSLNSNPNRNFDLEFYASSSCHGSGHGGGGQYLGYTRVTTNAAGNVPTFVFATTTIPTGYVTATATQTEVGGQGRTSEFSACLAIGSTDTIFRNGFDS